MTICSGYTKIKTDINSKNNFSMTTGTVHITCPAGETSGVYKVPDTKEEYSAESLREKIKTKYREYIKANGSEPLFADCRIRWSDDGTKEEVQIKLSEEVIPQEDDGVFFYCGSLTDLLSLTEYGVEDFVLIGCTF